MLLSTNYAENVLQKKLFFINRGKIASGTKEQGVEEFSHARRTIKTFPRRYSHVGRTSPLSAAKDWLSLVEGRGLSRVPLTRQRGQ